MKKQFFRVKQLADQTFSRAGKTEVLSDDLQNADRKVEYIRTACHKTSKSLSSGLVTQGQDPAAKEKRLKKYPEYTLSHAMSESSGGNTDESLLSLILAKCSRVEMALANEAFEHEVNVETKVVTPLNEIIDHEVPNILKHKRNLQKLILDMDSAKTRQQTTKVGSKSEEIIKEELEDAEQKVEQCRDQLASEMFMLISKEAELAQSIFLHVKLQREYHKSALTILDEIIPELDADINDSKSKPVYHYPLEEHLRVTGRKIAFPIELCVCALIEMGLQEEGLFRVAAGTSKLRRMKLSFDACCLNLSTALEYGDPHVIAGALKSYLRELPEPLMTNILYGEWMAAAKITDTDTRLNALWDVIHKLPEANRENLRYLIKFLAELTKSQSVNKMTPQNIAIVIAPNLIWSPTEETTNIGMNMNMANMYSSIVATLITYCDWFFKGENKFYLTCQQELREKPEREKETSQINGMTKSVGPVTATITPQDDLDYYGAGHVRSSSNDTNLINLGDDSMKRTQSNSSLSDSPPHGGSPKPATRRKNKPAPVPPANLPVSTANQEKPPRPAVPPSVSTLPRPAKKPLVEENRTVISNPVMIESSKFITMEKQSKGVNTDPFSVLERNTQTRRSIDFNLTGSGSKSQETNVKFVKATDNEPLVKIPKENENFKLPENAFGRPLKPHVKGEDKATVKHQEHGAAKSQQSRGYEEGNGEGNHSSSMMLIPTSVSALSSGKVTVGTEPMSLPFQMGGSSTLDRKQVKRPMPVAAPRSTVADAKPEPKDDMEGVTLRRPSVEVERLNKPAVPERPTTLQRPPSTGPVKTPRNSAELDALPDAERPSLERIHMYCVDKQQVSIIQVGGEREKDKTAAPSESEATPSPPHSDGKVDKPERPPKPDNIQLPSLPPTGPTLKTKPPSHVRTQSEGNIVDAVIVDSEIVTGKLPPSPGATGLSRPPRSQPPPPPPVKPRGEGGSGENTDL